jgi:hypothetical protein
MTPPDHSSSSRKDDIAPTRLETGNPRLGAIRASEATSWFDGNIMHSAVTVIVWVPLVVATVLSWFDKWIIDGLGVGGPAIGARMISYLVRLFAWGLVQWYALVMIAGLLGFGLYYVYR